MKKFVQTELEKRESFLSELNSDLQSWLLYKWALLKWWGEIIRFF